MWNYFINMMQVKDQNHDSSKINLKVRNDQYQLFFANAALVYRRLVSYIILKEDFVFLETMLKG